MSWQDTATAIATIVYAAASVLLLVGLIAAFLQLAALRRSEQLRFLESCSDEYRSESMLEHLRAFRDWARTVGEEAPFVYCQMRATDSAEFRKLDNHRRRIRQFFEKLGRSVAAGLISERFVLRHVDLDVLGNCRYFIGIEWRMLRQTNYWRGDRSAGIFSRWPLLELLIADAAGRDPTAYSRFKPTRREKVDALNDEVNLGGASPAVLPRYRAFLERLMAEPGHREWARAGLRAVDEDLTPEECVRAWLESPLPPKPVARGFIGRVVTKLSRLIRMRQWENSRQAPPWQSEEG